MVTVITWTINHFIGCHSTTWLSFQIVGNKMTSLNLATIFGPNLLHKLKSSDKEFSVQSSARAEESTAVIATLQRMIASYQTLFMVSRFSSSFPPTDALSHFCVERNWLILSVSTQCQLFWPKHPKMFTRTLERLLLKTKRNIHAWNPSCGVRRGHNFTRIIFFFACFVPVSSRDSPTVQTDSSGHFRSETFNCNVL